MPRGRAVRPATPVAATGAVARPGSAAPPAGPRAPRPEAAAERRRRGSRACATWGNRPVPRRPPRPRVCGPPRTGFRRAPRTPHRAPRRGPPHPTGRAWPATEEHSTPLRARCRRRRHAPTAKPAAWRPLPCGPAPVGRPGGAAPAQAPYRPWDHKPRTGPGTWTIGRPGTARGRHGTIRRAQEADSPVRVSRVRAGCCDGRGVRRQRAVRGPSEHRQSLVEALSAPHQPPAPGSVAPPWPVTRAERRGCRGRRPP
jgi:hypothetical protein